MVNLIDLLHQKIELFRLEQRYTRRRNRRSTFVSEAQYVDGEYVYSSPNSNASSKQNTGGSGAGSSDSEIENPVSPTSNLKSSVSKGLGSKRLSRMGMAMDWRKGKNAGEGTGQETVSVSEVRWDESRRT